MLNTNYIWRKIDQTVIKSNQSVISCFGLISRGTGSHVVSGSTNQFLAFHNMTTPSPCSLPPCHCLCKQSDHCLLSTIINKQSSHHLLILSTEHSNPFMFAVHKTNDENEADICNNNDTALTRQSHRSKSGTTLNTSVAPLPAMTGTMLHLIKWLPLGLIWTIRLSCDTSYSYQSGLLIHLLSIPQRESSPESPLSGVISSCNHIQ